MKNSRSAAGPLPQQPGRGCGHFPIPETVQLVSRRQQLVLAGLSQPVPAAGNAFQSQNGPWADGTRNDSLQGASDRSRGWATAQSVTAWHRCSLWTPRPTGCSQPCSLFWGGADPSLSPSTSHQRSHWACSEIAMCPRPGQRTREGWTLLPHFVLV